MLTKIRNIAGYITIHNLTVATVATRLSASKINPTPTIMIADGNPTAATIPSTATVIPAIPIPTDATTKPAKNATVAITSPNIAATIPIPTGITTGAPTRTIAMIKIIFNVLLVHGFCPCPLLS